MNGILDLQLENDHIVERMDRITNFIVYEVLLPQINDEFLIIDRYLNPHFDVLQPFDSRIYDERLWSKVINELCLGARSGTVRIIYRHARNSRDQNYPVTLLYPEHELSNCRIQMIGYPERNNRFFPARLHDRWLLKKSSKPIGLHIGSSLDNHTHERDLTITVFDDETLNIAIERFEHIWNVANNIAVEARIV